MKNTFKLLSVIVLIAITGFVMTACGNPDDSPVTPDQPPPPTTSAATAGKLDRHSCRYNK
ncbi:MAG: hypothetical protein FWD14_06145 [Treponema sp.]|nr:hypothetical protein [Treponema sp.]